MRRSLDSSSTAALLPAWRSSLAPTAAYFCLAACARGPERGKARSADYRRDAATACTAVCRTAMYPATGLGSSVSIVSQARLSGDVTCAAAPGAEAES